MTRPSCNGLPELSVQQRVPFCSRLMRANYETDVRTCIDDSAPTLILHRAGDKLVPVIRPLLAEHIPAPSTPNSGTDHLVLDQETRMSFDEIEEFITGTSPTSRT